MCRVFLRLVPGADVVKGLNTLSAWALQNGLLAGKQVRRGNMLKVAGGFQEKQLRSFSDLRKALFDSVEDTETDL